VRDTNPLYYVKDEKSIIRQSCLSTAQFASLTLTICYLLTCMSSYNNYTTDMKLLSDVTLYTRLSRPDSSFLWHCHHPKWPWNYLLEPSWVIGSSLVLTFDCLYRVYCSSTAKVFVATCEINCWWSLRRFIDGRKYYQWLMRWQTCTYANLYCASGDCANCRH